MAKMLDGAWPRSGATADTWAMYARALSDLADEDVFAAVTACVERMDRLPSAAAVRQAAVDAMRRREAEAPALPPGPPSEASRAKAKAFFAEARRLLEHSSGPLAPALRKAVTGVPPRSPARPARLPFADDDEPPF